MKRHGHKGNSGPSPTYITWDGMMGRCFRKRHRFYSYYGGRGILPCDKWRSFAGFLSDMGERPEGHTLERKNNNGPYDKDNCVWATQTVQCNNMRTNVRLTYNGKTQSLTMWARELGFAPHTLFSRRALGWPVAKMLSTPADKRYSTKR